MGRRIRRTTAVVVKISKIVSRLSALVVLVAMGVSVIPAQAGSRNTPDGQVLVLTMNLEEAYSMGNGDLGNNFEVDNFAKRVKDVVPQIPDVVLLQEVNYETSALAARKLTDRLGQRYVVAVRPIKNTTVEFPDKQVHTETAILLNSTTMAKEDRGGFIQTSYPRSAAAPGDRVNVRRHAFVLAREKASGLKMPLVSVHYAMVKSFKTEKLSNEYRGKWSKQIENKLAKRYNADSTVSRAAVVGGDFNASRCVSGQFASCRVAAWWKVFTSAPHKYVDTLFELDLPAGVDVLFSTGRPVGGNWDKNGDFPEGDRSRFYSDHRFRWTVVEARS
jgi:hypothetical protein